MEHHTHTRIAAIRALVSGGCYIVEAGAVAEAIVLRHLARDLVPDTAFRSDARARPRVRSFRRSADVRSFRPCSQREGMLSLG
ncbi:MAG: hypothetical protein LC720_08050 [Actinobacteria bacterium]|nr:hypothetical protein [Actinomycetota bacterium]